MPEPFKPNGLPMLIGSLPLEDHGEAIRLIFDYTPEIPLWAQLPTHLQEGMLLQFIPGMPGISKVDDRVFVDTESLAFAEDQLAFYESYMAITEESGSFEGTRFVLEPETAEGFFSLLTHTRTVDTLPVAIKGQITGPITFTTGIADQDRRAIFYHPEARDMAVKLLALKARWQVQQLSQFGRPVIVFLDEPALASFGSSDMIGISREEAAACLKEVADAVRSAGGLAGIHVCANTDWSLALDGSVDIINFDAYAYFDRFILYPDAIKAFIAAGGILAWGIVPTLSPEDLDRETVESLATRFDRQFREMAALGIDPNQLLAQSLITPSCGAGSLDEERAVKVLELTRGVSDRVRSNP